MAKGPSSPSSVSGANEPVDATTSGCKEKRVIVIDPGHGGTATVEGSSWNNAIAASGALEKTLNFQYAQSLKTHLESDSIQKIFQGKGYCEVKIILTRSSDVNLTGKERVKVATDNKADILMSIHFNGADKKVRGTETYYRTASNGSQSNESEDKALAGQVNAAALQAIQALGPGAKDRKVKPDTETRAKSIAVLRDPGIGLSGKMCRSCLLEVEFIDVPAVDTLLVSGSSASTNRSSIMAAVAKALANAL
jgi:N-acetylmuramoyl-L-alanine amidase